MRAPLQARQKNAERPPKRIGVSKHNANFCAHNKIGRRSHSRDFGKKQACSHKPADRRNCLHRENRNAGGATRIFSNAVGELAGFLGGLAISEVVFQLQQFGRESIRNAVRLDSQTRALAVLTGSMREAEAAIRDVQRLADLPGLRFQSAVDGTVALRAIGVEAETTTRILTELGNAAAFSGGQGEFERGLLGFRQLIQSGQIITRRTKSS